MDRPILVPLDGSRRAERALPQALALAEASGSSICLARVHVDPELPGATHLPPDALARWERDVAEVAARAERYLYTTADRLQAVLGTGRVRVKLLRDEPAVVPALNRLASRIRAGSIVIASRDRSPFARLAWLSVADGMIRRSGRPVMVITDTMAPRGVRKTPRILLPVVDVTDHGAALAVAAEFARSCGAMVTLARVTEQAVSLEGPHPQLRQSAHVHAPAAFEDLANAARILQTGGEVDSKVVVHTDRVAAILQLADAQRSDMILMPTRRRGALEVLLGSTASGVLRGAAVPVVLIGPRAKSAEPAPVTSSSIQDEPALFV